VFFIGFCFKKHTFALDWASDKMSHLAILLLTKNFYEFVWKLLPVEQLQTRKGFLNQTHLFRANYLKLIY